ncbi:hypothetical protein Tco_0995506 [Tanacetum coccineum]
MKNYHHCSSFERLELNHTVFCRMVLDIYVHQSSTIWSWGLGEYLSSWNPLKTSNLGDPSRLLDFEEVNMNPNNVHGPPPVGPPPQNHNSPPGPNLHMPAPDLRTIEELCQPTINGRGRLIAPVNIQATDFGLKNHMIQQVQNNCQFHGLPGDDANKHLDKFLIITQSMKQNEVTDDALRLYLFPYSLTHHAHNGSTIF